MMPVAGVVFVIVVVAVVLALVLVLVLLGAAGWRRNRQQEHSNTLSTAEPRPDLCAQI